MNSILLSELLKRRPGMGQPGAGANAQTPGQLLSQLRPQAAPAPVPEPVRYNALTNQQPVRGDVHPGYRPPGRIGAFFGIKRA